MPNGLIGLIIMLVLFNLGARLLRSLGGAQRKEARPKKEPMTLDAFLKRAMEGESKAAETPAVEPIGRYADGAEPEIRPRPAAPAASARPGAAAEEREAPSESTGWGEDLFESLEETLLGKRRVSESRIRTRPVPRPDAVRPADKAATAEAAEPVLSPPRYPRSETAEWLIGAENLRRGIVLSEILGPCRAHRRFHR